MKSHTGTYSCGFCAATFASRSSLKVHTWIPQTKLDKTYFSEICLVFFPPTNEGYKRHKRTHTGKKPYTCEVCLQTFSDATYFQQHMRSPTGEKPYKCTVCSASFSQQGNLNTRFRTHSGEKPYKCECCPAKFATSANFKVHLRDHTYSGELLYSTLKY